MLVKRRAPEQANIQMTPMIDMTFLLLVFFMVTSKITKEQKKLEIKLPNSEAGRVPDKKEDISGREIINIDEKGQIYTGEKAVDLPTLKKYLKQRLTANPPLKISVRADARTPAKQIKQIMQAASDAGAVEVVFSTYKIQN